MQMGELKDNLSSNFRDETEKLKDEVIRTEEKMVFFEPRLVFEIGYSEIQLSPNYEGGFALLLFRPRPARAPDPIAGRGASFAAVR